MIKMKTNDDYWDNIENENDSKCFQQQVVFIHDGYGNSRSGKSKTRRRRWTQKDMTNAFNAVKCTGMSLRGAASHYNVPESTLRDRVHGRVSLDCSRPGPPTFFTYEEEKKMVDHILFMSKIGYPYTRNQVVELAGDMTKAVDRIAPFKFLNPSQAWFYAFLNRWPDLKNYLYGPRSNRKSKGVSAESIQAYYDNLDKVLIKYDIKNKPDHIWMTDEVSIACDNSNVPKILPITIQRSQSNTYWNPTAAVLGAGNAAGDKIPAFLMFKASEISDEMMDGSVKGSKFATSNNGWVNADAFIQWYERHFRPLIKQRPVILLYDGHLQFVTVRVLEKAKDDNVLLFPLPPHPPYNHCVESSCFAAYPKYFTRRIRKYQEDFKRNVNKTNVSRIICQTYEWALQPINLIQTFFKLGICPYNNLSSSLAPYMPNSSDEDQNDDTFENMDINESEFVHGNDMAGNMFGYHEHRSSTSLTSSPIIDRSQTIFPGMRTSLSQSGQNEVFTPHSSSVTAAMYPNVNNMKVLDNMASKAMNQMHAQRTEVTSTKLLTALPVSPLSHDTAVQAKILSIKNSAANTSSIILHSSHAPINSICRVDKAATASIQSVKSSGSPNVIKVTASDSTEKTIAVSKKNSFNHIKVLKTSNNVANKPSANGQFNRPIIRLQSMLSNDTGAASVPMKERSVDHVRCNDGAVTVSIAPNNSNCTVRVVSAPPTAAGLGGTSSNVSAVGQLMELKEEVDEDQENEEMNQICHVCGRVEPPGLSQLVCETEELVVDWAHCDFCHKWVHLQPCCDSRCVLADNTFKCIICIKQAGDEDVEVEVDDESANDVPPFNVPPLNVSPLNVSPVNVPAPAEQVDSAEDNKAGDLEDDHQMVTDEPQPII